MSIFNYKNYSDQECKNMRHETDILKEKNPNHVPVLIILKSNILKIDKQKFLISNDILFSEFINNTLRNKLINLNNNDTIVIQTVSLYPDNHIKYKINDISVNSNTIKYIYDNFKDNTTNLLILQISRFTNFKYLKNSLKYILYKTF